MWEKVFEYFPAFIFFKTYSYARDTKIKNQKQERIEDNMKQRIEINTRSIQRITNKINYQHNNSKKIKKRRD